MSKIKYWKQQLKIRKQIYLDFMKALDFTYSKLSLKDVKRVYVYLLSNSKDTDVDEIQKKLPYNKGQLRDLIERLKMLGEVYDPYLTINGKGSKIVRII